MTWKKTKPFHENGQLKAEKGVEDRKQIRTMSNDAYV